MENLNIVVDKNTLQVTRVKVDGVAQGESLKIISKVLEYNTSLRRAKPLEIESNVDIKRVLPPAKKKKNGPESAKPRPKAVELLGNERSSTSIADCIKSDIVSSLERIKSNSATGVGNQPDYFKTGIKYKDVDGKKIPKYKLRYDCPVCGVKSNRYEDIDAQSTECHECGTKMKVEAATPKGRGTTEEYRDQHGNFLIANDWF